MLVIAIIYTLLLAGECQNGGKSPVVNSSCPCGNTYTYTMNVQGDQSSANLNDDMKQGS